MKPLLPLALLLIWATGCAHPQTRADFHRLIDRPRVALAPETGEIMATNDLAQIKFSYASDAQDRVPGILFKSPGAQGRRPVVIALHGTGGTKEGMTALCRKLVERGFIAVAIDARYHGERKNGQGKDAYDAAIVRAWHGSGEHPFFYDTVWDVTRLVDYLETRDDIDATRIGLIGISKGGIETYLTAAMDPRISVAVPCIGVQSFEWELKHNDWKGRIGTIQKAFDDVAKSEGVTEPDSAFVQSFYDRVVPGIYSEFDGPQMLPLIAPRPLLMINGGADNHTPLPSVDECIVTAKKAYTTKGAEDHFAVIIEENTGHKVTSESEREAIDWFAQWLKP